MPLIKSAIKREKQSKVSRVRNRHYKTRMLTFYKKIKDLVSKWEVDKATGLLPEAFSAIDTAAKKNLIKKKNASRKKSSLAWVFAKKEPVVA